MNGNSGTNVKPFGWKDKIGYMFGDLGNDFSFIFASSYLLIFYTKVLGISGVVVGGLFLIARCLDAVTDISMGRIVDTLKPSKNGRFRSWIRRMCVPVALTSTIMYLYFARDWSYTGKMIYMVVTYLLWGSFFYTSINIPYGSMASVISAEPGERASLSMFRSIGGALAGLAIGIIAPLILYKTDAAGNQVVVPKNFTIIAIIFGILGVICYLLCYYLCTERVKTEAEKKARIGIFEMLGNLFTNRALLAVIGAALVLLLASLLSQGMNIYLFMDYFKNTKVLALVSFISVGGMLLLAPFTSNIAKKYGKKEAGSISALVASIAYFIMFIFRIKNVGLFLVLMFIGFLGMGFFNLIVWAYITDVIDYQELRTNQREDGTVYALYSFARKLGQALAGGISGIALTMIGYISDAPAQTELVGNRIYTVCTLIPAICYLAVFLIMFFGYPLTKNIVEQNTLELKKRHEAAGK